MSERVFGHLDGNSFYASVERAFQPELRGKALIVLSNNDGCVVARSAEAKALGIGMGDPWHEVRKRHQAAGVLWRSSNYALYGDMSRRMYEVLAASVQLVEPYSIDEMFFDMTGVVEPERVAAKIREDVRRLAKIPSCVGLGPTKTIAKMANKAAKKDPQLNGICDLTGEAARAALYGITPVEEVWGIASRTAEKLQDIGVTTVADFVSMDPRQVRRLLSVVGARVQAELHGISCLPLSMMAPPRKCITVSRSFGQPVTTWQDLREAVATFTARAAEKLRADGLEAGRLSVFAHVNPHGSDPWFSITRAGSIEPTADTGALIGEAVRMLQAGWKPGYRLAKAGIMLDDLSPARRQIGLFATRCCERSAAAMAAMDGLNTRFGRGTIRMASTPLETKPWHMRQQQLSSRYTTRLQEILVGKSY